MEDKIWLGKTGSWMEHEQTCMIGCTVFWRYPASTGSETALTFAKRNVFLYCLDFDSRQFYKVSVKFVTDLMCLLLEGKESKSGRIKFEHHSLISF